MRSNANTIEKILKNASNVGTDACWEWQLSKNKKGYGSVTYHYKAWRVHRLVYTLMVGPVADNLVIDHICRNHACINPAHLEPVTPRENLMRGKTRAAENAAKTHCKYGHELSGDNLVIKSRGNRACRICVRRQTNEWHKKHENILRDRRRERDRRNGIPERKKSSLSPEKAEANRARLKKYRERNREDLNRRRREYYYRTRAQRLESSTQESERIHAFI